MRWACVARLQISELALCLVKRCERGQCLAAQSWADANVVRTGQALYQSSTLKVPQVTRGVAWCDAVGLGHLAGREPQDFMAKQAHEHAQNALLALAVVGVWLSC